MKDLIVPTDFSENANNALRFAINIANRFESTIHLIHIYQVNSQTGMFHSISEFMEKEVQESFAQTMEAFKSSLHYGTSIESKALEGQAKDVIPAYAKSIGAKLIVMGTQGASGLKEIFLGSNTAGVIRKSKIPVLAIPSGYQYQPFKNIAFAVDSATVTRSEVVDPLLEIAKAYNCSINIFQVAAKEENTLIDVGLDIYLSEISHSFSFIKNEDINKGINDFVLQKNIDLLCMIHKHRSFLDEIFHVSVTQKEVFNSPVPLLTLMAD